MKKILTCVLLVAMLFCFSSCKKHTQKKDYFSSSESFSLLTDVSTLSFGDDVFPVSVNENGTVILKKDDPNGATYGAAMLPSGNIIIPTVFTSIEACGNFLYAQGDQSMDSIFYVYNTEGKVLYSSDIFVTVKDIGSGMFSICTGSSATSLCTVYNSKGEDLLETSILTGTFEFAGCDDTILAHNKAKNNWYIFSSRGECLTYYFPGDQGIPSVYYIGNSHYLVVYTKEVYEGPYDYSNIIGGYESYYRQTTYLYKVGEKRTLLENFPILASIDNAYSMGITSLERKNFSLQSNLSIMAYHNLNNKMLGETLSYCIIDSNGKIVKNISGDVSAASVCKDGFLLTGNQSSALTIYDQNLNLLFTDNSANFQAKSINSQIIVTAKSSNNGLKYGAISTSGETIIPFEYEFLTPFYNGFAAAKTSDGCYLIKTDGSKEKLDGTENITPYYWLGFYEIFNDNKIGLKAFDGTPLVSPMYDNINSVLRAGKRIYIIMSVGNASSLFILS